MKKTYRVKHLNSDGNLQHLSQQIDHLPRQTLTELLWSKNNYKPYVRFCIVTIDNALVVKYYVNEEEAVAKCTQINGDVYKDSCVELFIGFNDVNYYNLEINCAGVPHLGYGPNVMSRTILPPELVKTITIEVHSQKIAATGNTQWEMLVVMPFTAFKFDHIKTLSGLSAMANVYKCGDNLAKPHYVAWNAIDNPTPAFHMPRFFGEFIFE